MEKIVQITSGRGPAECCWVVAQVLKILVNEAVNTGFDVEVLHREKGVEARTLFSATVLLKGNNLSLFLASWKGTIQWIGQSPYRKFHKRKNWFVGVEVLAMDESFSLKESDIKYEAIRSGGPGGQHVNKVSSAVRATHVPTGLAILASDSRSQHQNKKKALERLKALMKVQELEKHKVNAKDNWQQHNELERGNPIRVFKGSDFKSKPVESKKKKTDRQHSKQALKRWRDDE